MESLVKRRLEVSLILILMFTGLYLQAQTSDLNQLSLELDPNSLVYHPEDGYLALNVIIGNSSFSNLLLYGFGSNQLMHSEEERLCNRLNVGAGIGVFLFDSSRKRKYGIVTIDDDFQKPIGKEAFNNQINQKKEKFLKGTLVAKEADKVYYKIHVNTQNVSLSAGSYYLYLVYFSGLGVKHSYVVGEEQIENDCKYYSATLYQGCVKSNEIKFIIN